MSMTEILPMPSQAPPMSEICTQEFEMYCPRIAESSDSLNRFRMSLSLWEVTSQEEWLTLPVIGSISSLLDECTEEWETNLRYSRSSPDYCLRLLTMPLPVV